MFTCLSCQVAFADPEKQRDHFQTDWHRYNLKRKVAELPPLSYELFLDRLSVQKNKETDSEEKSVYCQYCHKHFSTTKTFENHSKSKKHVQMVNEKKGQIGSSAVHYFSKKIQDATKENEEIEEVDSDEWEGDPIPVNTCLFCSQEFQNLDHKLGHMSKTHSFFIPDLDYCVDMSGLITYLGEKVGCGLMCLWCSEKSRQFNTTHSLQQHMRDKGHCMMKFEGETLLEYSDFYDYSSSYPDDGDPDEEVDGPEKLISDGFELTLPSGVVIGHRSLLRYYRQKIDPNKALVVKNNAKMHNSVRAKIMNQYKALGYAGTALDDVKRRARDVQFMHRMKSKKYMKLGIKSNKLQSHFRHQVMF